MYLFISVPTLLKKPRKYSLNVPHFLTNSLRIPRKYVLSPNSSRMFKKEEKIPFIPSTHAYWVYQ